LNFQCPKNTLITGDPQRLKQVITNLLGNAIKFTAKGKVALIIKFDEQNNYCCQVIDTGIGIPKNKLGSIFSKFSQADSSTTREFGGTGLGLSISQQLVELMQGEIGVNSIVGKGSEFYFKLPLNVLCKEPLPKDEIVDVTSTTVGIEKKMFSGHVLLVEDNKINRLVVTKLLNKVGVSLDFAENGQEALNILEKKDYHLIFMDMQMPVMGGVEATVEIRRLYSEKSINIVGLTANAMDEHRQECLQSGMNDYMTKPINPEILSEMLSKYL